jgi:hypothetical protein
LRKEKNKYVFAADAGRFKRSHRIRNTVLILIPLLILTFVISNITVSRRVRLEEVRLTILNLPPDLEEYSILHISDLHGERYGEKQKAIKNALGKTRYSCVVMTGDMLGEDGDVEPLLELIDLLPADTPKYLIPGDMDGTFIQTTAHGSLSPYADWAVQLQEKGVKLLDRPMSETRGKGTIRFVPEEVYTLDLDTTEKVFQKQLATLNEHKDSLTADEAARVRALEFELERMEEIRQLKKEFQPEDIQIVLTHEPLTEEYVRSLMSWSEKEMVYSIRYASLILAGHYNGGQWRLPWKGAIYVPEFGWFPEDKEIMGLSYLGDIPQYISPGLGSDPHYENMPGRIYNPPVITKITLTRKSGV